MGAAVEPFRRLPAFVGLDLPFLLSLGFLIDQARLMNRLSKVRARLLVIGDDHK